MKFINQHFSFAYFVKAALSLLLVFAMTACSDDNKGESEGGNFPKTSFSKIELSEVFKGPGDPPVTTTHTYAYKAGRVSSYTTKQTLFVVEPIEMQTTINVTYGDHQAVVTDEFGTTSTYTLNDKGYAISCTRKEGGGNTRTYTFSYLTNTEDKCYLENITEMLDDGKVYATVNIDYSNYKALKITMHVDTYDEIYTATTSASNEIENTSEIPCLFLAELYPLSMHSAALYGKLLGEPFETLITQIIPGGNAESNETTTYTYKRDTRGIVTSCNETISNQGKNYYRTVDYVIE